MPKQGRRHVLGGVGVQIPTSLVGVTVQAPLHFLEAVGVRTPRTPLVAPALLRGIRLNVGFHALQQ